MIICNQLDLHELCNFVRLKMNCTIVTFLALQSPSRVTLDDKNTKYCFFGSSERANHHLLGCLLPSTERMNAKCAEIFGLCVGDGRWGEVYASVITFAHLLVFPQFISHWAGALIETVGVDTTKSTEQGVLSTLIDI